MKAINLRWLPRPAKVALSDLATWLLRCSIWIWYSILTDTQRVQAARLSPDMRPWLDPQEPGQ